MKSQPRPRSQADRPPAAADRPSVEAVERGLVRSIQLEPWQRWMLVVLALLFLYQARQVIGPFVIAAIIAYIFTGGVTAVQARLRWPRVLVAGLLYLLALAALGALIYFGARALISETAALTEKGPNLLE